MLCCRVSQQVMVHYALNLACSELTFNRMCEFVMSELIFHHAYKFLIKNYIRFCTSCLVGYMYNPTYFFYLFLTMRFTYLGYNALVRRFWQILIWYTKKKNKKNNKINQWTVVKSSYIHPQVLQAPTQVSHCPLHWFAIYRESELWSVVLVIQLGNYFNQQQPTILGS